MDFNDNEKIEKIITSLDFSNCNHKNRLRELLLEKFRNGHESRDKLADNELNMVAGGLNMLGGEKNE